MQDAKLKYLLYHLIDKAIAMDAAFFSQDTSQLDHLYPLQLLYNPIGGYHRYSELHPHS